MTTGPRKTHEFCFINVLTPHATEARVFFSELLGWTYGGMPGVPGGGIILVGGKVAGAIMDLVEARFPEGTPPVIGSMVSVASVDETVARLKGIGGTAAHVMDVMENGRMAECADPNGARFGLWQPKKQPGMDADSHAHGAPTWFETLSNDADRAAAFYTALFGWTAETVPMPGGGTYTVFKLGDRPVAGAMNVVPAMGEMPPHWAVSFAVTNADDAVKRAAELGGAVLLPAYDIADVGRFAALASPQGVPFQVVEWAT